MASSDAMGEVAGVLLAGGRSTRLGGGDKGLIALCGRPMLAHVIARLSPQVGHLAISANGDPARFAEFGLPVIADLVEGHAGPLAGLQAGFAWARGAAPGTRYIVTVPADAPLLPLDLVPRLFAALHESGATVAIAASGGARHPVVGLWDVALADELAEALRRGERAMHQFADENDCAVAEFAFVSCGNERIDPFFNVNTPADLATVRALLAAETARG
jgi:molybdopterin-guanine dinucleotide biosynthesis protein A